MYPPSAVAEADVVPVGRRRRKQSQTRAALTDAALRLFATKGYDQTTIEEITDQVDVSPRTFFRYFASKEEVLFPEADHRPFLDQIRAQPLERSDLEAVLNAYLAMLPMEPVVEKRALLLKKALESTNALQGRNLRLQSDFRLLIADALAERRGQGKPDDATLLAAAIAQAVMHMAFDNWAAGDGRTDIGDELRTYFSLTEAVLTAPMEAPRPAKRSSTARPAKKRGPR